MIIICKKCWNTSENKLQKMQDCCYDDSNLIELTNKQYYSIIKLKNIYIIKKLIN